MRKRLFIATLSLVSLILLSINTYAHYHRFIKSDVKVEAKNIDKGIQFTITSDDPEVTKELRENSQYYKDLLADGDYCLHMHCKVYHHHGCMG